MFIVAVMTLQFIYKTLLLVFNVPFECCNVFLFFFAFVILVMMRTHSRSSLPLTFT